MRILILLLFTALISKAVLSQNLFINEVLAINKTSIKTGKGKFKDCIEIYNAGDTNVNLSGYFLSDVKDSLQKWSFPNGVIIKSKGFVVIWADEKLKKNSLEEMHANFKLSSKKETIRLSDKSGNQIHKLKCKRQFPDISLGLFPNGSKEKRYMNPTIGKSNISTAVLSFDLKLLKDSVELNINSDKSGFIVYNKSGVGLKVIVRNKEDQIFHRSKIEDETGMIDLSELKSGRYELQIGKSFFRIVKN